MIILCVVYFMNIRSYIGDLMILKDKNTVITGARRGIGRTTVEIFAKNGAKIWAIVRCKDDDFENYVLKLSRNYNTKITVIYADISKESEVKKAISIIKREAQYIDVLANIAGVVGESSIFCMTPIEKMKKVFDVNFWGTTLVTQYVVRLMMRRKKGSIINISSIASIDGEPGQYEYSAGKAAINGAVKYLARELGEYNIRVNVVAPGIIDTDMGMRIEDSLKEEIIQKTIIKRIGTAEEVANVIAFLASDMSSYITGQIIRVDGGI